MSSSPLDAIRADREANADAGGPSYRDGRPIIQMREGLGEPTRLANEAESALLCAEAPLYKRGSFIARVARRPAVDLRDFQRPDGSLGVVMVDKPYLVELMSQVAHFERWDKRTEDWLPTNKIDSVAQTYLSRKGEWGLRPLLACIATPTLRPDGSLLQQPGYDKATATVYEPCGAVFPQIPERPTRDDADRALAFLRAPFSEFPWVDEVDESVFLSFVLTSIVRKMLDVAPMGGFSAPNMESGKSLLASSIGYIANGVGPMVVRYPEKGEEAAKLVLSILMSSEAVVVFDNIEQEVEGDWLCVVLTEPKYSGRMLGVLEMVEVPTNTLILATGNGLTFAGDMRTRALLCRIDPKVERPRERRFKLKLDEWIPEHRSELVAAALTLMRAFVVAIESGELRMDDLCSPWERYRRWSSMVRAPLLWLGMKDPVDSLAVLEKEDPHRALHVRFLTHWQTQFQGNPVKASEVIAGFLEQAARSPGSVDKDWSDVLKSVAGVRGGELSSMRLAAYLRSHTGRIVNDMTIVKDLREENGSALWKLVRKSAV